MKGIGEYMNVRTGVSGALALAVGQVGYDEADLWIAPLCVAPYQRSIRPRLYVLDRFHSVANKLSADRHQICQTMWCTMNVSGAIVVAVVVVAADKPPSCLDIKTWGLPLPCALALLITRRIHDVCHLGRPILAW